MLLPTLIVNSTLAATNTLATSIAVLPTHEASTCENIHHCRTIWNIVWSCLGTVFACIWVVIHPNLPKLNPPRKTWSWGWWTDPIVALLDKLGIAIVALLAPEYILGWALRQNLRARSLARECVEAAKDGRAARARQLQVDYMRTRASEELQSAALRSPETQGEDERLEDATPINGGAIPLLPQGDVARASTADSPAQERYLGCLQRATSVALPEPLAEESYEMGEWRCSSELGSS